MAMMERTSTGDRIDLRPLLTNPAAMSMLLLARGQLNRSFRLHGLIPPDPLVVDGSQAVSAADLEDPVALGLDRARTKFGNAFAAWAESMPSNLARPVLDVLLQTYQALAGQKGDGGGAVAAVRKAYEFLSECSSGSLL